MLFPLYRLPAFKPELLVAAGIAFLTEHEAHGKHDQLKDWIAQVQLDRIDDPASVLVQLFGNYRTAVISFLEFSDLAILRSLGFVRPLAMSEIIDWGLETKKSDSLTQEWRRQLDLIRKARQ